MELCLKTYGGFVIIVGWMEVDYQVNCCGCFFPLHTISESGLDWVAEEWRVVAVGNNNNKRIGERKAPLSTVMQLHNEDMIYVGWRPQRDGLKSCIYMYSSASIAGLHTQWLTILCHEKTDGQKHVFPRNCRVIIAGKYTNTNQFAYTGCVGDAMKMGCGLSPNYNYYLTAGGAHFYKSAVLVAVIG